MHGSYNARMRLSVLIALAFVASPAWAQQSPPQSTSLLRWQDVSQPSQAQTQQVPQPKSLPRTGHGVEATSDYMSRMDADGDGRVSPDEYIDWMSYAFDERDSNRNGVLEPDELPGGKGQPITRAQHRQRLAERFARQDTNHDGWLDTKELAAPPQ